MIYVAVEAYADLTPKDDAQATSPAASAATQPSSAAPGRGAAPRFIGGNTGRNSGLYAVGAAVAPTKLGLSTPRPEDFDAFWDGKLAEQAKIPIHAELTPVQTDVPGVELHDQVTLLGWDRRHTELRIKAEELARIAGTLSYEVTCGVSDRVPRTYI